MSNPTVKTVLHAWYSARQVAGGSGTSFYARADGSEIEVTAVLESRDGAPRFGDAKYLGEVVRWVRAGREGSGYLKWPGRRGRSR